jgi:flagellar biogenesis protein FliO
MVKLFSSVLIMLVSCAAPGALAQEAPQAPVVDPLVQGINQELDRGIDEPQSQDGLFARGDRAAASPMRSLLIMIAALCVVLALLFGINYALRRWGKGVPILAGPNLGKVLGRVYLDRGLALHFVRIGERVLVVGANGNSISTVGDFSASVFERAAGMPSTPANGDAPFNPDSFLAELQERTRDLRQVAALPHAEEDEIAALRGDIQRLQRYLREENRGQDD